MSIGPGDLILGTAMTVLSVVLFNYFVLPNLNNRQSSNNRVKKGDQKHKRINQVLKKSALRRANLPETNTQLDSYDFFSVLTPHEQVVSQCLVFSEDISVSFDDIGGLEDVKKSLNESVCFPFQLPQLFNNNGNRSLLNQILPKGILLYGPPGTGKTLLAKAVAKQCNCNFLSVEQELLGDYLFGESEKLASALFSFARRVEPCIIFIDEIDALLSNRNAHNSHEVRKNQLAIFLRQWDGFYSNTEDVAPRVIVIGATNSIESIDPAALRRLPLKYHVGLPDEYNRSQILRTILRHEQCDHTVNIDELSQLTDGLTGSDIKELIKKALTMQLTELAHRHSNGETDLELRPLSMNDIIEAKKYVIRMDPKPKNLLEQMMGL